jgi:tetratricopeptide (TPR) repeat protein
MGMPSQGAQQGEQPPLQPDLPGPVVAPDTASTPPTKPGVLTLENRADIFMARKAYPDAIEHYRRALQEGGRGDGALWNKLGIAYQQMQNMNAARRAYKEAIRIRKDFPEPWNNLGTTYYLEKKAKKSLKYYREAIKLNPQGASFHVNLGTAYYATKKIPEAIQEYRTALGLDPAVLTQRSNVGTTVSARTADAKFFFYMGKVFASLGRVDDAVRYLRHAFEDGFDDFKLLDSDEDYKKISALPAYKELRANPPKGIKE